MNRPEYYSESTASGRQRIQDDPAAAVVDNVETSNVRGRGRFYRIRRVVLNSWPNNLHRVMQRIAVDREPVYVARTTNGHDAEVKALIV